LRLDHYIAKRLQISERDSRLRIASGEFQVDGSVTTDLRIEITRFQEVAAGGKRLQTAIPPLYIALHKPPGILSATRDPEHTTVIDLIDHPDKDTLHLAGRLDRSSTGLILLTNDGAWSESLSHPDSKVAKTYLVETDRPIPESAPVKFAEGFPFLSEGITTRPASLDLLGPTTALVTLYEGRWHQIKRMFHRLDGIRLRSLHRQSIGPYDLDGLAPGEWCEMDPGKIEGQTC
jgi:16S rRNA pseudouridine516 synthase